MNTGALHGPIQVSPNHRYFVDARGEPFFWLGDTAWPLFTSYSKADAQSYLRDRAQKGFTVIQCVVAWGDNTVDATHVDLHGTLAGPNPDGELPWNVTPAEPNERFFVNVDNLLALADDLGLVLAILPTWGAMVNDLHLFDEESAYAYGLWLGKRYRAQNNLIWVNGGDREPVGFESIYRALAHGLRDGDGGTHLISYHCCGYPRSSSFYYHQEEWLDFNMIQTWTEWDKVYPVVAADFGLTPNKPVVMAEGAYEDGLEYPLGPITPLIARRQAWWTFMAGGHHTYGHCQNWRHEPGWITAIDSPGAHNMTLYKEIVTSRRWWEMIPDQTLIQSGVGSERSLNAAVRTPDRRSAMIYISQPCHFVVNIGKIPTRRVRATWVNPANGATRDGGEFTTGNLIEGEGWPIITTQSFDSPLGGMSSLVEGLFGNETRSSAPSATLPAWEDAILILDAMD